MSLSSYHVAVCNACLLVLAITSLRRDDWPFRQHFGLDQNDPVKLA